jgi:class 3 adenylate cyclase
MYETLKLRFAEPAAEKAFVTWYTRTYLIQTRAAFCLAILLLLLDVLVDRLAFPQAPFTGNHLRVFLVAPLLFICLLGTFLDVIKKAIQLYTFIAAIFVTAALCYALYAIDIAGGQGLVSMVGTLNYVFALSFIFVLVGLLNQYAVVIGFIALAEFLVFYQLDPIGNGVNLYLFYHLFTVLLLFLFLSYFRERFVRQDYLQKEAISYERRRSEVILFNILPQSFVHRIQDNQYPIADLHEHVTILFADLAGFTPYASSITPNELVSMLNDIFQAFDGFCEAERLEKVKTNGDGYFLVGGLQPSNQALDDTPIRVVRVGLQMIRFVRTLAAQHGLNLDLRVGVHHGSVIAGVIGRSRYHFDLWGDTVNLASRMESTGVPGFVQISESTYPLVKQAFNCQKREPIQIKGKGLMQTYLIPLSSAGRLD